MQVVGFKLQVGTLLGLKSSLVIRDPADHARFGGPEGIEAAYTNSTQDRSGPTGNRTYLYETLGSQALAEHLKSGLFGRKIAFHRSNLWQK